MIRSLFKKHHKFSFFRAVTVTTALASLLSAGCMGDDEVEGPEVGSGEVPDSGPQTYSIKAYVKLDGEDEFRLVEFPPVDSFASSPREPDAVSAKPQQKEQSQRRGAISQKTQNLDYIIDGELGEPFGAWYLAWVAAEDCASEYGYWIRATPTPLDIAGGIHLWSPLSINDYPFTCDAHLLQQQNMLCTANKLAEAAEALGSLTWTIPGSTVVIPPQSQEDRFILRDQAISILWALGALMQKAPAVYKGHDIPGDNDIVEAPTTCADGYAELWLTPDAQRVTKLVELSEDWSAYTSDRVVGTSSDGGTTPSLIAPADAVDGSLLGDLPGVDLDLPALNPQKTNFEEVLLPRMMLQAHLARAANRLFRDIVDDNIRADVAAGEKLLTRSLKDAWAMDPEENLVGYNSYRHALRTLAGAWPVDFATPGGVSRGHVYVKNPSGLCSGSGGAIGSDIHIIRTVPEERDIADSLIGLPLEAEIRPPKTPNQSLAWRMLRSAGLVIPSLEVPDFEMVRTALQRILVAEAARAAGIGTQNEKVEFEQSVAAKSLTDSLAGLSDEDVAFATRRALNVYSLLAGASAPLEEQTGILPLADLTYPWGGSAEADAVDEVSGFVLAGGIPEWILTGDLVADFGGICLNRDRASVALNEFRATLASFSDVDAVAEVIAPALAEQKRDPVVVDIEHVLTAQTVGVDLDMVQGFEGIDSLEDLEDRLALVEGSALSALCAAGIRSECSDLTQLDKSDYYRLELTAIEPDETGINDGRIEFFGYYTDEGFGPSFEIVSEHPFWLLLLPEGERPGRILGSLKRYHRTNGFTDWERERLAWIQYGRAVKDVECAGVYDTRPQKYCIDGVPRDLFVPVSNSLIGDLGEDVDESWRHYLELARSSAAKADELGRQVIEAGLRTDYRSEGAQLALAQMCGGFPEEDDLVSEDTGAAVCLEEEVYPVTYFGEKGDPYETLVGLCTPVDGVVPDIQACQLIEQNQLDPDVDVAALNFDVATGEQASPSEGWNSGHCSEILQDFGRNIAGGFNWNQETLARYSTYLNGGDLDQAAFGRGVSRLALNESDLVGQDWILYRGGSPMMSFVVWPSSVTDDTIVDAPAPGLFGEFPSCVSTANSTLACASMEWDGCCSPQAKKILERIGITESNWSSDPQSNWRRNVEGAMYKLATLAQRMPAGMFTVPVPVSGGSGASILRFGAIASAGPRDIPQPNGLDLLQVATVAATDSGLLAAPAPGVNNTFWQRYGGTLETLLGTVPENDRYVTIASNAARTFNSSGVLTVSALMGNVTSSLVSCIRGDDALFNATGEPQNVVALLKPATCVSGGSSLEEAEQLHEAYVPLPTLLPKYERSDSDEFVARIAGSDTAPDGFYPYGTTRPSDCSTYFSDAICASSCEIALARVGNHIRQVECSASDRVLPALDPQADGVTTGLWAATLACLAADSATIKVQNPPVIRSASDVAILRTWLQGQAEEIADAQRTMVAFDVPKDAVLYHLDRQVPYGVIGAGDRGDQILATAKALEDINRGFRVIRAGIENIASALGGADSRFEAVEIAGDKQLLDVALNRVDIGRQVTAGAINIARGLAQSGNIFGILTGGSSNLQGAFDAAAGALDVDTGMQKLGLLGQKEALIALEEVNSTAQIILDLNDSILAGIRQIDEGISQVSQAQLTIAEQRNAMRNRETAAAVQAAILSGDGFADLDADGKPDVDLPVNNVYRREYDILRQRYDAALASAKRYAYYARLAIEQRLGVRLDTLETGLGPLPAPKSWADEVCQLTGVDYEALRAPICPEENGFCQSAVSGDGLGLGLLQSQDEALIDRLADQYIGDYVDKLEEFVVQYNIQYPFQDSEDLAVVSLRDHILTPSACADVENLLSHSGDLTASAGIISAGWKRTGCTEDLCMSISVAADPAGVPEGLQSGAPLLPPVPGGASTIDIHPVEDLTPLATINPFANSVYQTIPLEAGASYELSWWDSGVNEEPGGAITGGQAYQVVVATDEWEPYVLDLFTSFSRTSESLWSERRISHFTVPESGDYNVGFTFLEEGATAIANVQVVDLGQVNMTSAPYVDTGMDGTTLCSDQFEPKFSDYFEYRCDDTGCYHELRDTILLDETQILASNYAESGIPAANYNYRHVGVALNAVGTGLIDCGGQNSSCFSNGFLEYDLEHSAFLSRITNYGGDQQCFSFGLGAVRHGKMLAAERVMGIPMSSTDKELIAGEEFMKPVLKGRPLDGVYRLRIYDREGFNIEQLEDVQLVLKHVYWSRVERTPN